MEAETDLPQVERKDPPDHHEAYWLFGYDSATRVGHYMYLAAERDDQHLRRESIFCYLPDGSVLCQQGAGRRSRGVVAAGDRLELECLAPFERWLGRYSAAMHHLSGDRILAGAGDEEAILDASVEIEVVHDVPPWNTEGDWGEQPPSFRYHQFYDARGVIEAGGIRHEFGGTGFRSHSRRRREMAGYTGHAIVNGRFPSGRGFGLLRYRATADRPERGRGFLYVDGELHDAEVVGWPHLTRATVTGEEFRIELRAESHRAVITGETLLCPFVTVGAQGRRYGAHTDLGPGFLLAPAVARFAWDGEEGYGALERSALPDTVRVHREGVLP